MWNPSRILTSERDYFERWQLVSSLAIVDGGLKVVGAGQAIGRGGMAAGREAETGDPIGQEN
jgi:hypothetical protein